MWLSTTDKMEAKNRIANELIIFQNYKSEYVKIEYVAIIFNCQKFLIPKEKLEFEYNKMISLDNLWDAKITYEKQKKMFNKTKFKMIDMSLFTNIISNLSVIKTSKQYTDESNILQYLENELFIMETYKDIFESLKNPAFNSDSWDLLLIKINSEMNVNPFSNPEVLIENILELNLLDHIQAVADVYKRAVSQQLVIEMISKHEELWNVIRFTEEEVMVKSTEYKIIKLSDENINSISNSLFTIEGLSYTTMATSLHDQLQTVIVNHKDILELNELVGNAQDIFIYLYTLFDNNKILVNIIHDIYAILMEKADPFFHLIETIASYSILTKIIKNIDLINSLYSYLEVFESLNHSIQIFLDDRRKEFSRFYFLSNTDLLCLITSFQIDIKTALDNFGYKLFPYISKFTFSEVDKNIYVTGFISNYANEQYRFYYNVLYKPKYIFFQELLNAIILFLQKSALVSYITYQMTESRSKWINQKYNDNITPIPVYYFPEQISNIILSSHVKEEIILNIKRNTLNDLSKEMDKLISSIYINLSDKLMNRCDRKRIENIMMQFITQRDLIIYLYESNCMDLNSFEWLKQFRFCINESPKKIIELKTLESFDKTPIELSVLDTKLAYGYEYLGESKLIYISPYMNTCVFNMYYSMTHYQGTLLITGDNSGKTTHVYTLSLLMGRLFRTINCFPTFDRILFDDFLLSLDGGKVNGFLENMHKLTADLLDYFTSIMSNYFNKFRNNNTLEFYPYIIGSFISSSFLSPGIENYIQNLTKTFRPILKINLHRQKLIYSLLYSYGLTDKNLEEISYNLDEIYLNCQKSFVSSIYQINIRTLIELIQYTKNRKLECADFRVEMELQNAIYEVIGSRLNNKDFELLKFIVKSIFGRYFKTNLIRDGSEAVKFQTIFEKEKLWHRKIEIDQENFYVEQCTTFVKSLENYDSLFVIGEPYTGKTTVWSIVRKYLDITNCSVIFPNSHTPTELVGSIHPKTKALISGLITEAVQKFPNNSLKSTWLVLDGEIDATWCDYLLPLIDNTIPMILPGGDLLNINNVKVIIETCNLINIPPSSIVKSCIVYFPIKNQWLIILTSWIYYRLQNYSKVDDSEIEKFEKEYFSKVLVPLFQYLINRLKSKSASIESNECLLIKDFLELFNIFYKNLNGQIYSRDVDKLYYLYESITLFSIVWILSNSSNCLKISEHQFMINKEFIIIIQNHLFHIDFSIFDRKSNIFDYFIDLKTFEIVKWDDHPIVKDLTDMINQPISYYLFIPSSSFKKSYGICHTLVSNSKNVIIEGPNISGKTQLLTLLYSSSNNTKKFISNFSENSLSNFKKEIEKGASYIFIDDLNCNLENTTAHGIPSIIRSHIVVNEDRQHFAVTVDSFYDRISNRISSNFFYYCLDSITEEDRISVYEKVLKTYYGDSISDELVETAVREIYQLFISLSHILPQSPNKPQYCYDHRIMMQLYESLIVKPVDLTDSDFYSFIYLQITKLVVGRKNINEDMIIAQNKISNFFKNEKINLEYRYIKIETEKCFAIKKVSKAELERIITDCYENFLKIHGILNFTLQKEVQEQLVSLIHLLYIDHPLILVINPLIFVTQSVIDFTCFCANYENIKLQINSFYSCIEMINDLKRIFLKLKKNEKKIISISIESIADKSIITMIYRIAVQREISSFLNENEIRQIIDNLGIKGDSIQLSMDKILNYVTFILSSESISSFQKIFDKYPKVFGYCPIKIITIERSNSCESVIYSLLHSEEYQEKIRVEDISLDTMKTIINKSYNLAVDLTVQYNKEHKMNYFLVESKINECINFIQLYNSKTKKTNYYREFQNNSTHILEESSNILREESNALKIKEKLLEEINAKNEELLREKYKLSSTINDKKKESIQFNEISIRMYIKIVEKITLEISSLKSTMKNVLEEIEHNLTITANKLTDKNLSELVFDKPPTTMSLQIISLYLDLFYDVFYLPNELSSLKDRKIKYQLDGKGNILLRKGYYNWNECLDLLFCREHTIKSFKKILASEFKQKFDEGRIPENNLMKAVEKYSVVEKLYRPNQIIAHNQSLYFLFDWFKNIVEYYNRSITLSDAKQEIQTKQDKLNKLKDDYSIFTVTKQNYHNRKIKEI